MYLQKGTETREWIHIFLKHQKDFQDKFQRTNEFEIAKLIFDTLSDPKNKPERTVTVYKTKEYIYRIGRERLHIIVDEDGWIQTAFPGFGRRIILK